MNTQTTILIKRTIEILSELGVKNFEIKDCSTPNTNAISIKLPTSEGVIQDYIEVTSQENGKIKYLVRSKAFDFKDKYFDDLEEAVKNIVAAYIITILMNMKSEIRLVEKLGRTSAQIKHYLCL